MVLAPHCTVNSGNAFSGLVVDRGAKGVDRTYAGGGDLAGDRGEMNNTAGIKYVGQWGRGCKDYCWGFRTIVRYVMSSCEIVAFNASGKGTSARASLFQAPSKG